MVDLIAQVAKEVATSGYAIALTGAGISTESGISDFRGPKGTLDEKPQGRKRGLSQLS